MKKQILTAALLSLLSAGLTAAELTVAATPVPHGDILRLVAPDLKAQGYDLKVVEFSDFVSPNIALDAEEVTANYYQHKPFLDDAVKSRGLKIASVAPIHILPMAAYSKRVKSLNDLPKGARISIPNDPANGGRALLLLQSAGVIKLKDGAGATATPLDIAENPRTADTTIYRTIITGIAYVRSIIINTILASRKRYLTSFPRQPKPWNLRANIRIGETRSREVSTAISNTPSEERATAPCCHNMPSEAQRSDPAGVGSPQNSTVCVSSMLNLARRSAENAVRTNTPYPSSQAAGRQQGSVCRQTCQSTAAGASPEVMTSANESSCTPIAEDECNRRATKPSKKSNTIPATISQKASVKSLYISAATTANDPQSRFMRVNKFGIVKSRIRICKRISPPISRQI